MYDSRTSLAVVNSTVLVMSKLDTSKKCVKSSCVYTPYAFSYILSLWRRHVSHVIPPLPRTGFRITCSWLASSCNHYCHHFNQTFALVSYSLLVLSSLPLLPSSPSSLHASCVRKCFGSAVSIYAVECRHGLHYIYNVCHYNAMPA